MTYTLDMNDLVTAQEVAKHFDVTVETVNRWVREKRVPYIKPSRKVIRFRLDDVIRHAESSMDGGGDDAKS